MDLVFTLLLIVFVIALITWMILTMVFMNSVHKRLIRLEDQGTRHVVSRSPTSAPAGCRSHGAIGPETGS